MGARTEYKMLTNDEITAAMTGTAYDVAGEKIGKVGQFYLDDRTGEPDWVSINTGLFGRSESLAPLDSATVDGDALRLAHTKDQIKDAPRVDADSHLDEADEFRLADYYGIGAAPAVPSGDGTTAPAVSSGTTDDAMTRSEERLHVGTEQQETGRARLRKYVVTEQQSVTVPVQHEEVRLEREPITDANRDEALSGAELTEAEHEVVLTEERVVVNKETVPVEQVRLAKETVTEQETVTEDVRKEQIETEGTDPDRI